MFTRIQLSLRVLLLLSLCAVSVAAQDRVGTVQVRVRTDHADWRYTPGQPVKFTMSVVQDGQPVTNAKLTYRIGPEQMPPRIEQTVTFTGTATRWASVSETTGSSSGRISPGSWSPPPARTCTSAGCSRPSWGSSG